MPAVLQTYLDTKSLLKAARKQEALLQTYRADFGKYGKQHEFAHLEALFTKLPFFATQQLKYSKLDRDTPSRTLKAVLEKLIAVGLIYQIFHSQASGIPLSATVNERKFKTLFLDVGLLLRACHVQPEHLVAEDALFLLQGVLMEQFVGQELLAYQDPYETPMLFFWARDEKSSQAKVDYLMTIGSQIIPIEVKSKHLGHLKSLKRFIAEKKVTFGLRLSEHPFSFKDDIYSIPIYAIFALKNSSKLPMHY